MISRSNPAPAQVDSVAYRYQPAIFETLHLLMLRGELDCSAMANGPTPLLERYRRALWETTAYVVSKLGRKAAPTEVRVFCSQALSVAFFRLPALRHTLLITILPPGEGRHKHVREWNLPWSLHRYSIREAEPEAHVAAPAVAAHALAPTSLWTGLDKLKTRRALGSGEPTLARLPTPSVPAAIAELTSRLPPPPASLSAHAGASDFLSPPLGPNATHRVDQWAALWSSRPGLDSSSSSSERVLSGRYWRERLHKRGHCFFLLLEHWVRHLEMAMGVQPGDPELTWQDVPGFPTMVKAFLIEMKQRPLQYWPESMVSCLLTLLETNRQLLQVTVRILLSRVSALQLKPSLAVLRHLDLIMHAVGGAEPLPQTFSAEPLLSQLYLLAESEHFKVAASALIFLYNHVDALGDASRTVALQWCLSRFARFSLHWSRVVRTIFFHIAVIKVLRATHEPTTPPAPPTSTPTRRADGRADGSPNSSHHTCGPAGGESGESVSDPLEVLTLEKAREARSGSRGSSSPVDGSLARLLGESLGSAASMGERGRAGSAGLLRTTSSAASLSISHLAHAESLRKLELLRHEFERALAALEQLAQRDASADAIDDAAVVLGLRAPSSPQDSPDSPDSPNGVYPSPAPVHGPLRGVYKGQGMYKGAGEYTGYTGPCAGRASGGVDMRRARGYAAYAWAEYEAVVKKWEDAVEVAAKHAPPPGATPSAMPRSMSVGGSCNGGLEGSAAPASALRRAHSAPASPAQPNSLALSLSMISAHVHDDDDDDGKESDEW
jgi:hypothetical protein